MTEQRKRMKICSHCRKLIPDTATCNCKPKRVLSEHELAEKKIFNSKRWKDFRLSILRRDGGYCQRCWIKFRYIQSTNIQVHHIKPRKYNKDLWFEPSNCIALCQTCNTQIGIKEELDFIPTTIKNREFNL